MSMDGREPTGWQDTVIATLRATPGALEGAASEAGAATVWSRIGGNDLSSVWSCTAAGVRVFVKIADSGRAEMLAAEAEGLQALAQAQAVRVPQVLAVGAAEGASFLVVEWLDIVDGGRDAALGRALAALHAVTGRAFGWHRDNTIGTNEQKNGWWPDWAEFFRDRRLAPQLERAAVQGYKGKLQREGERILAAVPSILAGHRPAASLLHGDLWAGNAARLPDGTPVVFDPAVYFGDREADLAMTELFGGFQPEFYAAYREASPLSPGYEVRRTLYNLYHVLNHLNLFGAAYRKQAEAMMGELLAASR